jgi:hypothetical protein
MVEQRLSVFELFRGRRNEGTTAQLPIGGNSFNTISRP